MNFPTERTVWSHAKKKWRDFHAIGEGERSREKDEEEEGVEDGGRDGVRKKGREKCGLSPLEVAVCSHNASSTPNLISFSSCPKMPSLAWAEETKSY